MEGQKYGLLAGFTPQTNTNQRDNTTSQIEMRVLIWDDAADGIREKSFSRTSLISRTTCVCCSQVGPDYPAPSRRRELNQTEPLFSSNLGPMHQLLARCVGRFGVCAGVWVGGVRRCGYIYAVLALVPAGRDTETRTAQTLCWIRADGERQGN